MANVLTREKQLSVLSGLSEGLSIRSVERMTGVHRDTVTKLLVRVGDGCAELLDEQMRDLDCDRLEIDELWSFVGKKQRHVKKEDGPEVGDAWTYVALDADTKLVPCFLTGKRTEKNTDAFIHDLAHRVRGRVQISTDGLSMYVDPILTAFAGRVDYAQVVKSYEAEPMGPGRYSPPKITEVVKTPVIGEPEEALVSTSYVERSNLSMRTSIRRFTRLTIGFSKKLKNHVAATAFYFAHYNFVRIHRTLRTTPAMEAGISRQLWSMGDLLDASMERSSW
jgi:IS1 family transposase